MAKARRAFVFYPGLPGLVSATYTLGHGITPGVVTLQLQFRLGDLKGTGDVRLTDGVHSVTIPNCTVVKIKADASTGGATITATLYDRRMKWQQCSIPGGWYNQPVPRVVDIPRVTVPNEQAPPPDAPDPPQGPPDIQEETRKDARELAEICLKAMGETDYDVHLVPDTEFPEVNWTAANAAGELQTLVDKYGLRVVYQPDSDNVAVCKLGDGAELPDGGISELAEDNLGIDPPEPPRSIAVYGAKTKYQGRFVLEAVGRDFDGRIKPLFLLSYQPSFGWDTMTPPFVQILSKETFPYLPGDRTRYDAMAQIRECVYRMYRIKATWPSGEELYIPFDSEEPKDEKKRWQVTLLDQTVETVIDDLGQRNTAAARVYGKALRGDLKFLTTSAGELVRIPFKVVPDEHMIQFATYAWQRVEDGVDAKGEKKYKVAPAEIVLETACTITDNDTFQSVRYRKTYPKDGIGDPSQGIPGELPLLREDILYTVKANYADAIDNELDGPADDNKPVCDARADYYARGEMAKYELKEPTERTYNGVMEVFTDGAIQQVTWSVGVSSVKTTASRNTEHSVFVPPYVLRRKQEESTLEQSTRDKLLSNEIARALE